MRSLRTGVLLALVLMLVPAVAACSDGTADDRPMVVMGPWLDDDKNPNDEHDIFERVLHAYAEPRGLEITYQGTRAIGQALRAKVRDGTLPDIVIMPTVGELAIYATEDLAQPVTSLVAQGPPTVLGVAAADAPVVNHRGLWRGDRAYAVAVKTDLKSLLIHAGAAPAPSRTLAQLRTTVDRSQWCLGLSEPSSPAWPATDWVEDLLLHQPGGLETYRRWASGQWEWTSPRVAQAFREFREHYVADPERALLTTPQQAADDLFAGRCALMHQSSFYAGHKGQFLPFPQGPVEVSGDFAARFTTHPEAEELLRFITEGSRWIDESDDIVLTVDPQPEKYRNNRRTVAGLLLGAPSRCLDASDAMPPAMAAAFQSGILRYVAEPDRLDEILRELDAVRQQAVVEGQFLSVACSR